MNSDSTASSFSRSTARATATRLTETTISALRRSPHVQFRYATADYFTFGGDDDAWVFVNHQLTIDLGGTHQSASRNVQLADQAGTLGLVSGVTYELDLFHAERHSTRSDFGIETTIELTDCGEPPPELR